MNEIAITKSDVSKVEDCALNVKQLNILLGGTPKGAIYERPAKGGGVWRYVTGTYVKKVLNLTFGFDWSFEIKDYKFDLAIGQVFVHGRLTVNSGGKAIVKEQFGRQDIKFKTEWIDGKKHKTDNPLDLGNDLKAATTDALKKCASELGIASDVYAPNEFKAIKIVENANDDIDELDIISNLLETAKNVSEIDVKYIDDVLANGKTEYYKKIIKLLKQHQ